MRSNGDPDTHAQYRNGTVRTVNEYHTVIEFDAHGKRTFVSPRVVLTDSMEPAPVKPTRKVGVRKKKVAV